MRDSMLAIATRDRFELFDRSRLDEGFSVGDDTNAASSTTTRTTTTPRPRAKRKSSWASPATR